MKRKREHWGRFSVFISLSSFVCLPVSLVVLSFPFPYLCCRSCGVIAFRTLFLTLPVVDATHTSTVCRSVLFYKSLVLLALLLSYFSLPKGWYTLLLQMFVFLHMFQVLIIFGALEILLFGLCWSPVL